MTNDGDRLRDVGGMEGSEGKGQPPLIRIAQWYPQQWQGLETSRSAATRLCEVALDKCGVVMCALEKKVCNRTGWLMETPSPFK